ncbi:glycosyltransferase [Prolixibacter sp. SD074]|uniref:glycosyltransferase n=1 Tax=Prolixibacter sp. SD074 TaxID=2652391 RepID=UPI001289DDA6|nr:glycosyltransferase family 2 protein [Prolixibacter sp. SD074]GET29337.1 glycosyl transferase [Prolixibacter sp. SD074]
MDKEKDENRGLIPIIILNWNGEKDTISCLRSIKQTKTESFIPVIVDNGSKIESLATLKNECNQLYRNILYIPRDAINNSKSEIIKNVEKQNDLLIFIENNENLGFAKGNNIGIEIAKHLNSNWVMLLNNDTEVEPDALDKLESHINNNENIYAVTPQIRFFHDKEKIWNCGGELTYFGSRKYYYAGEHYTSIPSAKNASDITFVTGCALLFRYKETGVLTEDFFFGEEDYEFSLRLKMKNLKMTCLYGSIIYHKVGSTIKKNNNTLNSTYLYYINRLIDVRNYYSSPRWHITKIFAYLYLPVLLIKNNINPSKAFALIMSINKYVNKHNKVDANEFNRILKNK